VNSKSEDILDIIFSEHNLISCIWRVKVDTFIEAAEVVKQPLDIFAM